MSEQSAFLQDNSMNAPGSVGVGLAERGGEAEMEEPPLDFEGEGLVPPTILAPPIVHSQHANDATSNSASVAMNSKTHDTVRNRRQRYRTNRPISARQQATKRNEPPALSSAENMAKNVNAAHQLNVEQTPTVQRLTKKKFRHQSSYEEAPEPEAEVHVQRNDQSHVKLEPTEQTAGTTLEPKPTGGDTKDSPQTQSQRTTKPRKWLAEEDEMLRKAVEEHGAKHWKNIAQLVPGRSHVQCLQRWNKVLKPGLRKGPWTEEEDGVLTSLVEGNDQVNWTDVSNQVFGRSAKQCRERWYFNLDPRIKKGEWTEEEDNTLISAQQKFGNRWAHISTLLAGRTENAVKTRFKSIMRAKKREWSTKEDEQLLGLQLSLGSKWDEIAKKMPNRTKNAVKTRFKMLTEESAQSATKTSETLPHPVKQEPVQQETFTSYVQPTDLAVNAQQFIAQADMHRKEEISRCQSDVIEDSFVAEEGGVRERKLFQKYYTAQPETVHQDEFSHQNLQPQVPIHYNQEHEQERIVGVNETVQSTPIRGRQGGEHTVDNILDDLANMDMRLVDGLGENQMSGMHGQAYGTGLATPKNYAVPETRPEPPRPNLRSLSGLSSLLFASDNSLVDSECGSTTTNAIFGVTNNLADNDDIRIPDVDQNGQQETRAGEQMYAGNNYAPRRPHPRRRLENQKCHIS